jgi:hypothetical protein
MRWSIWLTDRLAQSAGFRRAAELSCRSRWGAARAFRAAHAAAGNLRRCVRRAHRRPASGEFGYDAVDLRGFAWALGVTLLTCGGRVDREDAPRTLPDAGTEGGVDAEADAALAEECDPGTTGVDHDGCGLTCRADGILEREWPCPGVPTPWAREWTLHGTAHHVWIAPDAPEGVRAWFDEASPVVPGPELLYPFAETTLPANLYGLDLAWRGSQTASGYLLTVTSDADEYQFFLWCSAAPCVQPLDRGALAAILLDHPGSDLAWTLAESAGSAGPVGVSGPLVVRVGAEPLEGELYARNAADSSIERLTVDATRAEPFIVPRTASTEFGCVGCHSVSRDGSIAAFAASEADGESTSAIQTLPVVDPSSPYVRPVLGATPFDPATHPTADPAVTHDGAVTRGPIDHLGNTAALNPDGSVVAINGIDPELANNRPPWFELRDTRTGSTLQKLYPGDAPLPAGALPVFAEWSPDGGRIVATLSGADPTCLGSYRTCSGDLGVLTVTSSAVTASELLVQAAPGEVLYYPTWAPLGDYVAFLAASSNGRTTYEIDDAVLRLVPATGGPHVCPGPTCWELRRAMQVDPATTPHVSWPKFAPTASGNLLFLAFTARLPYGAAWAAESTQVWLAAIDLGRLDAGDPSAAPFRFPGLDASTSHLQPQWAVTAPCETLPPGGCSGCSAHETCVLDTDNTCSCRVQ